MTFDPTKFDNDSAFDPAEFIVPSCDAKGHSVIITLRAPGQMKRSLEQVAASRRLPYVTATDVMRHALARHLDWLSEVADLPAQTKTAIAIMKLENEHMRRQMEEKEFEEHFDLVRKTVQDLLSKPGGKNEARRVIARAMSIVRQIPDGFYRDRHLIKLEEEFSHILEDRPKGNGKSLVDEDDGDGEEVVTRRGRQ